MAIDRIRLGVLLGALALAASCGSSGGGGGGASSPPPPGTAQVVNYYNPPTNTIIESSGAVLLNGSGTPTSTKSGLWTFRFPPAQGNGLQSTKTYVAGVWDQNLPWREWNGDSSIRYDRFDQ